MYFGKIQKGSDWFIIVTNIFSFGQIPKDTERLEGVIAMIDTWSMAYSCLVCVVGLNRCYHYT